MTHYSEDCRPLNISQFEIRDLNEIIALTKDFSDVCVIILPLDNQKNSGELLKIIKKAGNVLRGNATLIIIGDPIGLVNVHQNVDALTYQLWISIKRSTIKNNPEHTSLPQYHFGALVYTRYKGTLKHTITRIKYTYCPSCDRTTKDYGGKKHTYNSYGTLISDIWRDIACDPEGDLSEVIDRFVDLFGLDMYQELRV